MWASGPFFWSSCIKSSSLLFTTSYCQMVIKRAGWNITNDSNMAHGPPSCDQFDPSPRWITKKKSIQQKCLHQDLIKPKDLGNHSEKQICETIPSDNSWKYTYLLDSDPSKGSVVMRRKSNLSTRFFHLNCSPASNLLKEAIIFYNSGECCDSLTKLLLDDGLLLPNSFRGDVPSDNSHHSAGFVSGSPWQASRSTSVGHGIWLSYHLPRNIGICKNMRLYVILCVYIYIQ